MPSIFGSLRNFLKLGTTPAATEAEPGTLRADDGTVFEVESVRRGGMGVVYLCRFRGDHQDSVGPRVALKTFDERFFFDADMSLAVQRETVMWLRLSSLPFIFPLLGTQSIDRKPYLLMPAATPDRAGALSLAEEIGRSPNGLETGRCLEVALCVAIGLAAAEERIPGLVHGDIKPDNLLFLGPYPCVADFGLARLATDGGRCGTPAYMAPELWDKEGQASLASDIYAFGATLYEALVGRPPVRPVVSTREEWAAVYRGNLSSSAQRGARGNIPFRDALEALALRALAESPHDRPLRFAEIRNELLELAIQEDPLTYLHVVRGAGRFSEREDHGHSLLDLRVSNLLTEGHYQAALDVLTSAIGEQITGDLLLTAGSTYSLNGDDETALQYFDRFLETAPEDGKRWRCLNEYGLSLRRLGRLQQAKDLFRRLGNEATGDMRVTARGNYAAVLIDLDEVRDALGHLQWITRHHPDGPEGWALLSIALDRSGKPDRALDALRQAISRAPRNGQFQVMLAGLLFRQMRLTDALAALDTAFGVGHHTRQWLRLTLATYTALGRDEHVRHLIEQIASQFTGEELNALEREAIELVTGLVGALAEESSTDEEVEARNKGEKGPATEAVQAPRGGQSAAARSQQTAEAGGDTALASNLDMSEEKYRSRVRDGLQPHMQIRMSMVDGSFALDFYFDTASREYVTAFKNAYGNAEWQTTAVLQGTGERDARYRFACCRNCAFPLLTSRDEGESFLCQACGERGPVETARSIELETLAQECERAIGREPPPKAKAPGILFVAFWADDPNHARDVAVRMAAAGFSRAPLNAGAYAHFEMLMHERNAQPEAPLDQVWYTAMSGAEVEIDGRTPAFLDRIIRELRREVGTISSASASFPASYAPMLLAGPAERARILREEVARSPYDAQLRCSLVTAEIEAGNLSEASRIAAGMEIVDPRNVHALTAVAEVALAERRPLDAVSRLERVVEAMPRDLGARALLIAALRELGETSKLTHHLAQYSALGGRIPAHPSRRTVR